jgi:hypothetical protein
MITKTDVAQVQEVAEIKAEDECLIVDLSIGELDVVSGGQGLAVFM